MAQANIAGIRLTLDGADLTSKLDPRLTELTLNEQRGGEADELTLTLHNTDGRLAIPSDGKILSLALGWLSGSEVATGLVSKGQFKVDEVEASGPPDQIRITARSADLAGSYRKRRTGSWKDTTLSAILTEIATRNSITAQIHPDLASKAIVTLDQNGKSDMALVRDLGSRYDAVATWKDRKLIFMPVGSSTTALGKAIPSTVLTREQGWQWRFTRATRDQNDAVEAQWHDQASGRRKTYSTGGSNPKRLKRTYASEADAKAAADGEAKKRARGGYSFEYDLALADCTLAPNGKVSLSGWGSTIDAIKWLITSVETRWTDRGIRQRIILQSA